MVSTQVTPPSEIWIRYVIGDDSVYGSQPCSLGENDRLGRHRAEPPQVEEGPCRGAVTESQIGQKVFVLGGVAGA